MMQDQNDGLWEKAIRRLVPLGLEAWNERRLLDGKLTLTPDLNGGDVERLIKWIDACLADDGGQVAARDRAVTLAREFKALNRDGRARFLMLLAEQYAVDEARVERAMEQWRAAGSEGRMQAALALRDALEPPRMTLLTRFNGVPEGVKFLVDLRAELLSLRKEYPQLAPLEADLKRLLGAWFDVGLLQLEQISWQSSAELLEKLIAYEAVHAIRGWNDLKNRLRADRRCFAFFHPNMPNEPLIFVEVALVEGMAGSIQALLDEEAPVLDARQADTAIFYSISNAQAGLAGISFGNFLIKRVVKLLRQELPQLKQFATLSPIPGFRRWLEGLSDDVLAGLPGGAVWRDTGSAGALLDPERLDPLRAEALRRLMAWYLCREQRRGRYALDPVAHFHLSNGAQVARLNWVADLSEKGRRQSAGMMVNYRYELPRIEARSQSYTVDGAVATSASMKKLLKA
ncbi:Malonyl-CoA decarboxylase, putative [Alloalcanivorax dieselolei B5]|uniref:Malonyl-CoA decarboxylase, putative n=1 Tax=Alcanivorax dieselolei (strain DSM 16502 / CGMCC 1.3690 / MCCC 1A00001 / B-5) TaxID=930169 RepID=K0CIC3_ALCDB|nr:malonyl-CoA decarboxylase [Alloalcanivorax dieselolei]AFT72378.1 Malonyl-CoA decarboxylase, putative [Alloalcanivorax dieselolei B5]GGJ77425.1 malonyl-CoA decarboxylase [Alloalcanivorax dieselolei]